MKYPKFSIKQLSEKLNLDKKSILVIIIGIVGVLLLVLSELIPSVTESEEAKSENEAFAVSYSEYEKDVEDRLESIISEIDGAGSVRVMVTLDCSVESVYAQTEKSSTEESGSYENEYVIIKNNDGENGILLKTTQPQIRGVAVVCTGGNSQVVRQNVTNTITAVLGVSAARVSISAMKINNGG